MKPHHKRERDRAICLDCAWFHVNEVIRKGIKLYYHDQLTLLGIILYKPKYIYILVLYCINTSTKLYIFDEMLMQYCTTDNYAVMWLDSIRLNLCHLTKYKYLYHEMQFSILLGATVLKWFRIKIYIPIG